MCIYKYEVINLKKDNKKPYLDNKGFLIVPNIGKSYKYYIECLRYNPNKCYTEYFLLLSMNKFSSQCKKCRVDDFGRLKVFLRGEIKDAAERNMKNFSNVNFEYIESEDNYDVFIVG